MVRKLKLTPALATLTYQGDLNFNGADTLTVLSTDSAGTPLTDSDTVAITVNSVNDAPVNTVPGAQTVDEDTALSFTGANLISVNDVDGNLATTQLTVTNGDLTVTLSGAAMISAGSNGSSTLTISGSQADINATLASLTYQGDLNFNGADTLTVLSTDSAGTPLTDSDTVAITVTAVGDSASIGSVSALGFDNSVTEDLNVQVGDLLRVSESLTITDPDAGESLFSTTVVNGTSTAVGGVFLGNLEITATGTWTYNVDNTDPQIQALGDGETIVETFTVSSLDGSATQLITVTINGVNDTAIVSSASHDFVESDVLATVSGSLTITDPDAGQSRFLAETVTNATGSLTIQEDGSYTYTANSLFEELNEGEALTGVFTVQSVDGTPTTVTINVTGVNSINLLTPTPTDTALGNQGTSSSEQRDTGVDDIDEPENSRTDQAPLFDIIIANRPISIPLFQEFLQTESNFEFSVRISDDLLVALERAFKGNEFIDSEVADTADEVEYRGQYYDAPALSDREIEFLDNLLNSVKKFEEQQAEDDEESEEVFEDLSLDLPMFNFMSELENEGSY